MNAETLTSKYISNMEKITKEVIRTSGSIIVSNDCIGEIINYIQAYLADAKYYKDRKQFETSLTAIAYCEGLLDALKLIGAVKIGATT